MTQDVYLISTANLVKKLSRNEISDYLALKHFIVFMIIFNSGYILPLFTVHASDYDWVEVVIIFISSAAIHYYGLNWVYQINSKGDGKEFFKRFCCLSLPISVNVTVVMYMLLIGAIAVVVTFSPNDEPNELIFDVIMYFFEVGYLAYFYELMAKSIRVVAKTQ